MIKYYAIIQPVLLLIGLVGGIVAIIKTREKGDSIE